MGEKEPPRIFVVDDDQGYRRLLPQVLESLGFPKDTILAAASIPEIQEQLYRVVQDDPSTFRLLLLDLDLNTPPDGVTFLRQIREQEGPLLQLPVIVITGIPNFETKELCEQMDNVWYLEKPFSVDELNNVIKQVYESLTPPEDN